VTRDEIEAVVRTSLGGIAPEVDLSRVKPTGDLRDELDIDSMDFLRFVVDLHARLGVEVPEREYPRIRTLASWVEYLVARAARPPGAAPT
jgi:acyl carrier protein